MKIVSKVLLFVLLGSIVSSCDSQPFSSVDILNDEDFSKLMFANHKSQTLILSDREYSKQLDKIYNEYMEINNLSCCDYQIFDKSLDSKVIEYFKNECLYSTQFEKCQKKYGDLFINNFMELYSEFKKLHPEIIIGIRDVKNQKIVKE